MKTKGFINKTDWTPVSRGIILGTGIIFLLCSFALPLSRAEEGAEKKEEKAVEKKEKETVKAVAPATPRVDYASLVEKMTRTKKKYSINTFDTLLDVKVIYKSPALRSAFVEDYAAMSLFSPAEKADLQAKEEKAAREGEEFLVAIFTTDPNWSDLNKADPPWRLYLYDDQNRRLEPSSVHKTSVSSAKVWKFYSREITPWTKLFTVTFPKNLPQAQEPFIGPDTKKIRLVFAGVLGRAEVEWDLK